LTIASFNGETLALASVLFGERGVSVGNQAMNEVLVTMVFEKDNDYLSDEHGKLSMTVIDMPNRTEGSVNGVARGNPVVLTL